MGATSDAWARYPHVRQELGYYATSDLGWRCILDGSGSFQNHFTRLDVCRVRKMAKTGAVRLCAPLRNTNLGRPATTASVPAFRLELFDSTSVEFCLHQTSQRGFETNDMPHLGSLSSVKVQRWCNMRQHLQWILTICEMRCATSSGELLCVPVCFNKRTVVQMS